MMLSAMQHMDSSAYASPSSASPWQQLLPAERGHLPSYEALPSAPAAAQQHRAARRIAKRRPRPSRRLPTTYISADPAEFRRMVHQVTGADESLLPPPQQHQQQMAEEPLLLHALAGRMAAGGADRAMLLPTLDTSAFLLGGRGASPAEALPQPLPPCDAGPIALDSNASGGSSSGCGFPTLESWDLL
ncbi:calmodulin-binding protein 25-like [Lolium rigidum]|uniref:calmodulin-binding protein 25-like n=1 Tax=Lolium rigidum TaxID=89674 RepID=UPI001F5E04C4|nr:calmodulin-binding protein 25-like [Lolium rigidum]